MKTIIETRKLPYPLTRVQSKDELKGPITLLLHGFMQTAQTISQQLQEAISGHSFLSIQAPFPVFRPREGSYNLGYTWFFYDPKTSQYLMPREFGIDFLLHALQELNITDQVQRIIGFSQGGYLAPFIASKLPHVEQVIGIHARFRHEDLLQKYAFRLDQIHGEKDQVVDPVNSRESHEKILDLGNSGQFHLMPKVGHEINSLVLEKLKSLI